METVSNQYEGTLIYIFGATGDLAKRKLFPAIYSMVKEGKLDNKFAVIGLARRQKTNETFREDVKQSIQEFARHDIEDEDKWEEFANHFHYMSLNINDDNGFMELNQLSEQLERNYEIPGNRLFYLALAPELFGTVTENLEKGGLLQSKGWHRLVIEKPFGYDLKSAEQLNTRIRNVFEEEEIFRIDHYLGKEMVQNIEVIRFANTLFEPLWNNKYIDNVQVTLSETVGVEDRGGYYENSGALRDMGQNHILQMLAMIAMEPPSRLEPEDIRNEKVKVLRSLRPYANYDEVKHNTVRGQYLRGEDEQGNVLPGYREEELVSANSNTETYFAAKLFVDNFRWAGVPFYVRTGKRLPVKATEVVIEFKNVPKNVHFAKKNQLAPNLLVIRVSPKEGVYLKFNVKEPGSDNAIMPVAMDFSHSDVVGINTPEAYERLLNGAIRGDSTFFTRWDEVKLAWEFVDQIQQAWAESDKNLQFYEANSWGPKEAQDLLSRNGHHWWPVNGQGE